MLNRVAIGGVGIHPFGRFERSYREMGAVAAEEAMIDAGLRYDELDFIVVANVGAEMAKGHNVVELVGRPGIPILNVEAACASSAGTLWTAANMIEAGTAKAVLCLGVEKAPRGFISGAGFDDWQTQAGLGLTPLYFAMQAQELIETGSCTIEDLADVSVKNHAHAATNENAMYRQPFSRAQVLESRDVCTPLTLLMLCAPNEGAAAAVLADADWLASRRRDVSVRLRSVRLVSRGPDDFFVPAPSFQTNSRTSLTARAARGAFEDAGIGPGDLDLVECQDTDSGSELMAYRDLGLCAAGEEGDLLQSGATTLGGRIPVNVSGGLLSKGEPLGASGLGQLHELTLQLRGQARGRQVEGARWGLAHVMGAGHNASVTLVEGGVR